MGNVKKVFLSHASEDKSFVDLLYEYLTEKSVDCWFDKHEIKLGDSIPEAINTGLAACEFGVLVLSPSYLSNHKYWTWEELWALINKESANGSRIIIPIRLGLDHSYLVKHAPLLAHRLTIDFINSPEEAAEEIARVVSGKRNLTPRPQAGDRLSTIGLPGRHTVMDGKPRPMDCAGREDFLLEMLRFFERSNACDLAETGVLAVSGLPGAGKSTIVLELVYRLGRQFPGGAYWFDCGSNEKILRSVTAAEKIIFERDDSNISNLNMSQNPTPELVGTIRAFFESEPCFLVFDSLDSELANDFALSIIPRSGASRVVITTRSEIIDTPFLVTKKSLHDLSDTAVAEVLLQFTNRRICQIYMMLP